MLTVAKVTQGQAGDYAEYLEAKTHGQELGDYYLKDGDRVQAPGRWAAGADIVGSDPGAEVGGGVLRQLMDVRRPDTGELLRRAGAGGEAVAAIDATFSAPKSVSAVWAVAAPALRERIERAHEQAIDRALGYSLRFVAMVRERIGPDRVIHRRAGRLIATSWRHTTARAVGGLPPDPQLHSHVLLHAAVRRDGQVVAIDSRSWLVHRREVGAAYRTELARGLSELGFGIRRGTGRAGRYFEISGVPQALVDRWSSRHHQVHKAIARRLGDRRSALEKVAAGGGPDSKTAGREIAELELSAQLSPKVDRYLTTATRAGKSQVRTSRDLDQHWHRTAHRHRFDSGAVKRLRSRARRIGPAADSELVARLTEFDATFADREARAVALEASVGTPIPRAFEPLEQLRLAGELLPLADAMGTTRQHLAAEERVVELTRTVAATRVEPIPQAAVQREARELDQRLKATGARLSSEQRAALGLACSDRQLVVIEGQAGSGKSTTLAAVARAHRTAGQEVLVTSTSSLAAERLAGEVDAAGAPARAYSTVALDTAIMTGALDLSRSSTVIHDEAALASTREQQRLLSAVQESGARLIEVGDPRQSQPVGAAGLWSKLEHATETNHARVELSQNVRARDEADQRDQRLFRQQQVDRAVGGYAERNRVTVGEERRQVEDQALDAAHTDRQQGKRTLVIAQTTNEHLDELNARAQAIRHQAGELGPTGAEIPGRPYQLHTGDEVQVRHTIAHPALGALRNGTTGQIIDVARGGQQLTLRLADGRDIELERSQIEAADLRLAYVQHPFPAQGQTTETAHLVVSEHATQEGSYVALTRARERTHMYAATEDLDLDEYQNELGALAERMRRTEPETPAIDTPLAHESQIAAEEEAERRPEAGRATTSEPQAEHDLGWEP